MEKFPFKVIYRWRIYPGKEEEFIQEWREGTKRIIEVYGSGGSRLHKTNQGTDNEPIYLAYAAWQTRENWEQMMHDSAGQMPTNRMLIEHPICMEVADDLLVDFHTGVRWQ